MSDIKDLPKDSGDEKNKLDKKKPDKNELDKDALDKVSGGRMTSPTIKDGRGATAITYTGEIIDSQ